MVAKVLGGMSWHNLIILTVFGSSIGSCGTPSARDSLGPEQAAIVEFLVQSESRPMSEAPDHLEETLYTLVTSNHPQSDRPTLIANACANYLAHFPFTLNGLRLRVERLEGIIRLATAVKGSSSSSLPACQEVDRADEIGSASKALEKLPEGHEDGGRCAEHLYQVLCAALRKGPGWSKSSTLEKASSIKVYEEYFYMRRYVERLCEVFPKNPVVLLA